MNVIQFPLQRGIPMRIKTTRSGVEKRLKEAFDNHLEYRITLNLYSTYVKQVNHAGFNLPHVVHCFEKSVERDVDLYRQCFTTIANKSDDWSVNDYRRLLSIVLSLPDEVVDQNTMIGAAIREIGKKIETSTGQIDRLYAIEIKMGN